MSAELDGDRLRAALRRVWPDAATLDEVTTRPLGGGVNARSFLASAGSRRYVLRMPVRGAPALLDFATEVRAMRAAAAAGLAPHVVGADLKAGVLLTQHYGGPWTTDDMRTPLGIARLTALLRALHAVDVDLPVFDASRIARSYFDSLGGWRNVSAREQALGAELLALTEQFSRHAPTAFCHNDLVASNVLDDGTRLLLVDFEYAVRGAPLLDLANVAAMNDHTPVQCRALLAAYYEGSATAGSLADLETAVRMVRLLAFFWARVGARRAADVPAYEELAARLDSTL